MGLDFDLNCRCCNTEVFSKNITHNLTKMADEAGIYEVLWRPKENNYIYARDIIGKLNGGLGRLNSNPEKFKEFNAPNGWGMYEHFVLFVEAVLEACNEYPDSKIEANT